MTPQRYRRAGPSRLLLLLLFAALCVPQVRAASLPTGGSVAAGAAAIGTASNKSLTVTQTSSSAVINWQSFSVGAGYTVNFVQPSSTSAILNRVTGSTPSTIAGSISANGQVYLINPNGIAITSTGTVNAAAFVASTLAISDDDFMAGKRVFTGSGASAAVSNAGIITIGRGGYAALLGGSVDHTGTITVPLGKVGLGSGEQATLDLSGDGFLQVAIPTSASGSGALVANSGTISADGGLIQLSAAAAKDLARQAINMSGTIEAKSVGGTSGNIVLAGSDGAVEVSGTLDATSSDSTGGAITVTGRTISLTGANLDASGATGGGTIRVGGGRQGTGTLAHADTLTVDSASTIKADATSTGDGGDVVLWSDQLTTFAGTISAKGGAISGDGGQAEVSGKALLSYTGLTDLSAANGSFGTLLLDPYNVTISDAASTSGYTATGNDSVINAATLITALGTANVTISTGSGGSQDGDITVASALAWSSGSTLTLAAANSIAINANITIAGSGGLALNYGGDLTFASGASASFLSNANQSTQSLTINGSGYTLLRSMSDIDGIDGGSGRYALAISLDATGTPYTDSLVSGTFTGTFEGLGNTITGLTIAKISDSDYTGMFNVNYGTIRDFGLVGGSVSGANYVGGLVGYNTGAVSNAYSTGAVSGGIGVGGLVGFNAGAVSNDYATGAVSGSVNVGGLVGFNGGAVSNDYATGAVSGSSDVGGLVGYNFYGSISNAYSTGAVSGSSNAGGLVGYNVHGTISNSYWDTSTSGQISGIGYDYSGQTVTGLTTALLQDGSSASGLGSAFTLSAGLYPYLTSFFPSGVQAVSGIAYKDSGTTLLASGTSGAGLVYVRLGDGSVITATTGVNGYYYAFAASGSIDTTNGSSVLAYTVANATTGATDAATYTTKATGSLKGVNVYGNTLTETADSTVTTLSALDTAYATATSGTTAASLSLANRSITALASAFTIDQVIDTASSLVIVTASGHALTVASPITVESGGKLGLLSGGTLSINALITVQGAGAVSLAYDSSAATNLIFGSSGSLSYTGSGGALSINGASYTLLHSMAEIDAIDTTGLSGSYALANSLVASGTTYTKALVAATAGFGFPGFTGTFEGLGHTITGLTIATSGDYTGLFGVVGRGGVVRDIGLVGGSVVSEAYYVGGLVGDNTYGTITNAYSTGAVSGTYYVGGLVGINGGTITNAYATGAVSGWSNVGGLVGENDGTISNDYATGAVSGSSNVGGLVGYNNHGTISSSYWDTSTSGQISGIGSDNNSQTVTGLTTAQLQDGSSASGLGSAFTLTSGLYPYLTSFFPSGVQAVSGIAYKADGTTVLASTSSGAGIVYVRLGDGSVITATTGANGYYYAFAASGSIDTTNGSSVLAYTLANASTGATNAATYTTKATGSLSKFNVYGNTLTETADSSVTTLSALDAAYAKATSGTTAASSITNRTITALASGFSIDDAASVAGTLVVSVPGNLTIASTGSVSAADVSLQATGAFINESGSDAVRATNRWLIYSADSAGDTFDGLDSGNAAVWSTAAGATVSASGKRYVFAVQPTVTVTTTDASKTYGDVADVAANYTVTGAVNGVAGAYLGVADASILSGALSSAGSATTADVGSYGYTLGTLGVASGYAISLVSTGTLTVTARPITVTANAATSIYGDAPSLTYTITSGNLVNGDSLSGGQATSATRTSPAGSTYAITQGSLAASANYAVNYVGGATLTITARPITVSANAATGVYGDATPSLSYTIGGSGLANGDALSGSLATSATSASSIGSYAITQGTLAASANYAVTYVGASLTIGARPITLTAVAATGVYGDATPSLTYTVGGSGLVNGDSLSGNLATSATSASSVGNYAITQNSLSASANYAVTYVGANLTISARPITVTANAATSIYGDTPSLSYTVGGLVNGDSLSGNLASATSASSVGSYAITQGTLANSNYRISYTGNTLTITARPITVTANAATSVYGYTPSLTYVVGGSGLVNGDTLSGNLASATRTGDVGVYAITQGTLANGNYRIAYTGTNLTITARPITVTADSLNSYQGFAIPALTYTLGGSGLANGDTLSGGLATLATSTSAAGRYAITQGSLAASANYALTFVPGLLTVSVAVPSDTSALAPAVTRSWTVNNDWAVPTAPTSPLELTFGSKGTLIFSSPDFGGLGTDRRDTISGTRL